MFAPVRRIIAVTAIFSLAVGGLSAAPALARDTHGHDRYDHGRPGPSHDRRSSRDNHWREPVHRGPVYVVPSNRMRVYRNIRVVRPYGHWYPGYGPYRDDAAAYRFLAFTAITVSLVNQLNEAQERAMETAQVQATTAPIGQTIAWTDNNAAGSVTATREGTSSTGRYCREFQQVVTIGGRQQQAYGTACQQPDGAWEIISTGDGTN